MKNIVWLYGRSGAGKTTLAQAMATKLRAAGQCVFVIDGDELRKGLCSDLDFGEEARKENHRRAAALAKLAASQGHFVIAATMCPTPYVRSLVRHITGSDAMMIYVDAPADVCSERDPKGLYRKDREGWLLNFDDYRVPTSSEYDFRLPTANRTMEESLALLLDATAPPPADPSI